MFCQAVVFGEAAWYNTRSMQHMNASKTARLPSLVETISRGFSAVNRCLWVVLIPFILDLFYWSGPRLSPQPLFSQMARLMQNLNPEAWASVQQQMGEQFNITNLPIDLSFWGLPRFINLLMPFITTPPKPPVTPGIWHIGGFGTLLGTVALINLVGLIATTIYLLPLAQIVRGEPRPPQRVRRWGKVFGSLLAVVLMVVGLVLAVIVPLSMVALFLSLVSPAIGQFILVIGSALLFWLLFTVSFAFDAVVVSDANPVRALLTSLFIVQRSFWGAAGLLILSWVIITGLSIVWQMLAGSTVGLLVAMIGSAYISTGMAAAHLVFYRDRLSRVAQRA